MIKKDKNKILNIILICAVSTIFCISVITISTTFIYVQKISHDIDAIKVNSWTEKTNNYDDGALSFFNNKIEVAKKDHKSGNLITGELINISGNRITEAAIYFKLYDSEGNIVDLLTDTIKTWDSGEKWIYSMPLLDNNNLGKYEFAEIDISY